MKNKVPVIQVIVRDADQLGSALQRFRVDSKFPQKVLSERSGVKQPAISTIESGSKQSRLDTIFKLLAGLDLELVVRPRTKSDFIPRQSRD